ncbi:MAG: SDR family NAD(P)-dependent oxidoreductase, partial [Anderseniella sp.]|nr:SDR family NAD(P)-dependent oxidoreductase [Anderseniella sp.]
MADGSQPLGSQYKTALVTGAASGIGAAVAQRLLSEGIKVYGSSRDPQTASGAEGIQWLRMEGGSADGVDAFIKENRELLDRLDILINNAGSSRFGSLADSPEEALSWQLQLLLETPMQLTKAVLPGMQSRGNGCILNVSSLAASFPLPFMAAYSAG